MKKPRVLLVGRISDMRDGVTDPEDYLSATLDLRRLSADNPPDTQGGYFAWYLPTEEDIRNLLTNPLEFDTLVFVSPRAPEPETEDTYARGKADCITSLATVLNNLETAQFGKLRKVGVIAPWQRANKRRIVRGQLDLLQQALSETDADFFVADEKPTESTMPNLWEKLWG